ncbi:MAG TPA: S8 family serine peptidase [Bryobacteraceae bacterium]|nr:S8 family serine peptidase [Bryobacteraceae bacterium]
MKQTSRIIILVSILSLTALAQDHYLVRAPASAIGAIANRHGVMLLKSLSGSGQGLHVVSVPNVWNSAEILQSLKSDPQVQSVEHDAALTVPEATTPGPQLRGHSGYLPLTNYQNMAFYYTSMAWGAYVSQPAAAIIRVPDSHRLATGAGTVAFLDTGVDFTHPVLASSLVSGIDLIRNWPGGSDAPDLFQSIVPMLDDQSTTPILDQSTTPILDDSIVVDQSTTPILDDDTSIILGQSTTPILDGMGGHAYGHGTMVAGLIHLVAPTAKLMPVKVFSSDGTSTLSLIISGIYYAVDHGAKVINMSFSFTGTSQELTNAISYANGHGVILVAAAGNNGQNVLLYPAAYGEVMGIGSTNNQDGRSSFSNFGAAVTLAAPGEGLITTYPFNHYAAGWGTSFSTPLVAGAAALFVDINYGVNESQAQQALSHAVPVGQQLGSGVLDLVQACQSLNGRSQNGQGQNGQ